MRLETFRKELINLIPRMYPSAPPPLFCESGGYHPVTRLSLYYIIILPLFWQSLFIPAYHRFFSVSLQSLPPARPFPQPGILYFLQSAPENQGYLPPYL